MEPYSIADRVKIVQEYYRNGENAVNAYRALRDHFGAKIRNDRLRGRFTKR